MSLQALHTFKISALALATVIALSACGGDDGDAGPVGAAGPQGEQGTPGQAGTAGTDGKDGETGQGVSVKGLTRIATVPLGAEVTGMFLTEEGDLFFNAQHPSDANTATDSHGKVYNKGTVGVITGLNFNKIPANVSSSAKPTTQEEQETVQVAIGNYQVIGQTGDTFGGKLANGFGNIYSADGAVKLNENHNPDFNGFVQTAPGEGYLYTNWELIPGGMSRLKIKKQEGQWIVQEAMMVDFSSVQGTAANCFGSVSPWGTPLTSEEWVLLDDRNSTSTADWNNPDLETKDADSDYVVKAMGAYVNGNTGATDLPNPYRYGYIVEITDATAAAPKPVKHFTLGRVQHENSVVMPDERTVYTTQDDTGGVLLKFVADQAQDLSSGTLYAAKLKQDDSKEPAVTGFDVTWVPLASGSNTQIEAWIAEYDTVTSDDFVEGQSNYMTLADIEAWARGDATYPTVAQGGSAVTAGKAMDDRAAFIETRQAAKAKNATAEFRKLEGININQKRAKEAVEGTDMIPNEVVTTAYMYFGNSDMDNTMIDDEGDIQLDGRVKDCGAVWRMPLLANYDTNRIEPVLTGSTYRSSLDKPNRCDVNNITQPDNVMVMDDGRILIGEDASSQRLNDTLWMYDPNAM
ncbi:DUF839 domain-containing protein [Aestuariibacter sp. AA17]|uniref:DUF839 domain-containing protein n=1 Tax=Fluctibacter corallii TaxID=2984329 RepID=A0ABT3ABB4_9ALTE|nr:alkaline phosphatase PhoX [Aestuariibacter sp. AA17]MCV2885957.1 DUF839 domain-containing protein [Aestuariibacter sp. AA17]